MTYFDIQQQNPAHSQFNPQGCPQAGQPYGAWSNMPLMQAMGGHGFGGYGQGGYGQGQAAYGQQYGQYGGQPGIAAFGWGQQQPQWAQWGGQQQRQLSQQDVNEVVRQLVPALPQILAQAQQPYGAIGYAAFGQAPRQLSQQDVNEVVRQLLPIVPQGSGWHHGSADRRDSPGRRQAPCFQSAADDLTALCCRLPPAIRGRRVQRGGRDRPSF